METWLAQTEENHRDHMNNLGFRARLEKAATDLNIKLIKNKRRSLAANVNESITSYSQCVLDRFISVINRNTVLYCTLLHCT